METDTATRAALTVFDDRESMTAALADGIEAQLKRAIAEKGRAGPAVSGGSTPAALYEVLSSRDVGWSKVTIMLVDDRWVAPGDAGSNETFVQETLLQNKASTARFIGLYADAPSPADALNDVVARFDEDLFPLDVVVLGMGPDGHTASWFPYADGLQDALTSERHIAAVTAIKSDITGDHVERMTLTLSALKDAQFICIMMAGEEKRSTYEMAALDGSIEAMPVRAIMKARPDLFAAWAL